MQTFSNACRALALSGLEQVEIGRNAKTESQTINAAQIHGMVCWSTDFT